MLSRYLIRSRTWSGALRSRLRVLYPSSLGAADRRAIVLRNGIEIGSAPVSINGPVTGTWAYALHRIDRDGQHWLRVQLSDEGAAGQRVPVEEWKRYQAPEEFRRAVASIVQPGMTIVVTPDSLQPGALVAPATVLEGEQEAQQKQ